MIGVLLAGDPLHAAAVSAYVDLDRNVTCGLLESPVRNDTEGAQ